MEEGWVSTPPTIDGRYYHCQPNGTYLEVFVIVDGKVQTRWNCSPEEVGGFWSPRLPDPPLLNGQKVVTGRG